MTIRLPFEAQREPLVRVLTAQRFGFQVASAGGAGPWLEQPMLSRQGTRGFELLSFSRVALPAVGECKLRFRYGRINDRLIGITSNTTGAFNPSTDTLAAPDLRGHEIRVQMAPHVDDIADAAWRTVWWGTCEYQEDSEWPAAAYPSGDRIYHCVDGFFRAKRWPLNRHGFYRNGFAVENAIGHPGYNTDRGDGRTLGNRDSSGAGYNPVADCTDNKTFHHCWPGAGTTWTDLQAGEHALRVTRPAGEPLLSFYGSTDLLTQANSWTVGEDESAWDFISRLCRRQRGKGLAFVDWASDSANPTGPLAPRITIRPLLADDINKTLPSGASFTVQGASAAGTGTTVDLIGDHRAVEGAFRLGDRNQHRVDEIESVGERIQVLVTLSYYDGDNAAEGASLEKRWESSAEATFAALARNKRTDEAWRAIWQLHGLPRDWAAVVKDHNRGATAGLHRVDYRCADDGSVSAGATGQGLVTAPPLVEILPDLPLLEGYTYTGATPARKDAGTESGSPARRPPFLLIRKAANRYQTGDQTVPRLALQVKSDGLLVYDPADADRGTRTVSDRDGAGSLGAVYDLEQLGVTVALRLPHRVRLRTESPDGGAVRRRMQIEHDGLHLWIADSAAIWDLDGTTRNSSGYTALRGACSASSGRLRDDRDQLARHHHLACAWYLENRRTCTWALRACGFLPSFENVTNATTGDTTTVNYPTLGQMLTSIAAGGQVHEVNTPITSVTYDHQDGVTTWATDWSELDFQQ